MKRLRRISGFNHGLGKFVICGLVGFVVEAILVRGRPAPVVVPAVPAPQPASPWGHVMPRVQLSTASFGATMEALSGLSGAVISVDWENLPELTAQSSLPVEMDVRDVSLEQVLPWILKHLAKIDQRYDPPICLARDGKIVVTYGRQGAAFRPFGRIYDVRDLLADVKNFRERHPGYPLGEDGARMRESKVSMADMYSPQGVDDRALVDFVTGYARFVDWSSGAVKISDGNLILLQAPDVQEEAQQSLELLRSVLHDPASTQPATNGAVAARSLVTLSQMTRVLPRVGIPRTTIRSAVQSLRKSSGANIFVDWNRLTSEEAALEVGPIYLTSVQLGDVLGALTHDMSWQFVEEGNVIVDRPKQLVEYETIVERHYDVRDLLEKGKPIADGVAPLNGESPRAASAQRLIAKLFAKFPEGTWPTPGYGTGTGMRIIGTELVVRQRPGIHEQVKAYLGSLRSRS